MARFAVASAIEDETGRGLALTGLAHHLQEPAQTRAITGALDTISTGEAGQNSGEIRAQLLALARELGDPARHRITQRLLDATAAGQEDSISVDLALDELRSLLEPAQLSRAMEIAAAIRDDYARKGALASLVPHLHGHVREKAIEGTRQAARIARDSKARWPFTHDDETVRAELLITVAPYLDGPLLVRRWRPRTPSRTRAAWCPPCPRWPHTSKSQQDPMFSARLSAH